LQGQGSNKIKLPELIKARKEVQDKKIENKNKEVLVCQSVTASLKPEQGSILCQLNSAFEIMLLHVSKSLLIKLIKEGEKNEKIF